MPPTPAPPLPGVEEGREPAVVEEGCERAKLLDRQLVLLLGLTAIDPDQASEPSASSTEITTFQPAGMVTFHDREVELWSPKSVTSSPHGSVWLTTMTL